MGKSIIYKKLSQSDDIKIKLDKIAMDLETHGRSIVQDPVALRLMSRKLKPFRSRRQIFIARDNVNNASIISVNPKFKMIRPNKNRLKILEWK